MTKQHFIVLAAEIAKIEDLGARRAAAEAVSRAARQFNPAFKPALFWHAAGCAED